MKNVSCLNINNQLAEIQDLFIVQIKIMPGKLIKKPKNLPSLLQITNVFGPSINESLTFNIPPSRVSINRDLFAQIKQMKSTAAHYRMAYLTANQVESFHRVFLINKLVQPDQKIELNTNKEFNRPEDFHVYINPEIIQKKGLEEVEQTCLVFPFLKFKVPRYSEITLKFRDQLKEYRQEIYTGFISQLIQHCINHINGELLIDYELSHGKFFVDKESVSYFPKTTFLLKEYSYRLKTYHSINNPSPSEKQKFQQMKKDYTSRLQIEYDKESQLFSTKITNKKINII